jgi:Polysaccharide lyase family 4, domain II
MMRAWCVIVAAVVSMSILTGCSDQLGSHQTVTGLLVRVGGPAPGSPVPLPGTVAARNAAGAQFTATTGKNGRFRLSLPPGTYRLTGHSPQVIGDGQQELCLAVRTVHVTRRTALHNVWVVCSIP